jgi:hypothetical protein
MCAWVSRVIKTDRESGHGRFILSEVNLAVKTVLTLSLITAVIKTLYTSE